MKRIFVIGIVLTLVNFAMAIFPMTTNDTTPTVMVCMRSDTTGLPVAGLTVTNFSLKYTLSTGYLSAALTGEAVAYNAAWGEPTGGKVGVYEEITSGSTGVGTYRIYLPAAFMTSVAAHGIKTVSVIDATGGARAILQVMFSPPNDTVLTNGTTPPTLAALNTNIWQNTTASDFTIPGSIGQSLFTGVAPGEATGLPIVGSEMTADLTKIHGSALTETPGQLAAAFTKYFDIASPTSTMNQITGVTTTTNLTNLPSIPTGWLTADGLATDAAGEIADGVWDEDLRDHVLASSTGLALAGIPYYAYQGPYYGRYATEKTGSTSTTTVLYLTHTASSDNDFQENGTVLIEDSTHKGQMGIIKSYDADTDTITLTEALHAAPTNGALIYPCPTLPTMGLVVENSLTYKQIFRILAAVMVGKSSYSGGVVTFTGIDGTTVRASVTISGQSRTSVSGLNGD